MSEPYGRLMLALKVCSAECVLAVLSNPIDAPDVPIGIPAPRMVPELFVHVGTAPEFALPGPLTLPAPDGVAQTPSPRQNVFPLAPIPLPRLVTGRLPIAWVERSIWPAKSPNAGWAATKLP